MHLMVTKNKKNRGRGMVYIVRCSNSAVTDYYLDVVGKMFEAQGESYCFISLDEIKKIDKKNVLVVSGEIDFRLAYAKGFRNLVFWVQGITPEESYLKHKSKARYLVLSTLMRFGLKKCTGVIYVSNQMKSFLENKYHIDTTDRSFIMPCFNDKLEESCFFVPNKYKNNVFCYVGSLSRWQCFDKTVSFYKRIEEQIPNAELLVFTGEKEKAEQIISSSGIRNYKVGYCKPEMLKEAISNAKFGFVLREDIPVNQVATPTKISSYLSAGLIPIFSSCLVDFFEISKDLKYAIPVSQDFLPPEKLLDFCKEELKAEDVLEEYQRLFNQYYSSSHYIKESKAWIKGILKS